MTSATTSGSTTGSSARTPPGVREHLHADPGYQSRLLRFLENHDEPRVADRMSAGAERAAAVAVATLPGATLWHEGQFEGRRVRPPVFLSRRRDEAPDAALAGWYPRLLAAVAGRRVRAGTWRLLEAAGWPDNQSCRNLVAWSWDGDPDGDRHVVVVHLSAEPAQGRIRMGWAGLPGRSCRLAGVLGEEAFERSGDELAGPGLFVTLGPWEFHLLALQ